VVKSDGSNNTIVSRSISIAAVEVAHAPGVNRQQSAHKTATHISVDLVIVLFRVDVTCHTSRITLFVVYKQQTSLI